jgi:hypothetical protein
MADGPSGAVVFDAIACKECQLGTILTDFTLASGVDISTNTTTGTRIGTAVGQRLGFWAATPIVQPAGADQVALNAYGAGANGLDSGANMAALHALVVAMRLALVNAGIMKGAA